MAERETDTLWQMLKSELDFQAVREVEAWLDGEIEFIDLGYGKLSIEPYDGTPAQSARTFYLRHDDFGRTTIQRAAFQTVLNDLAHTLRPGSSPDSPVLN